MLDFGPHFLDQIVREFHPADVERKTKLTIFQEISLKSLPEGRGSHQNSEMKFDCGVKSRP
jgi:hypothetical protein